MARTQRRLGARRPTCTRRSSAHTASTGSCGRTARPREWISVVLDRGGRRALTRIFFSRQFSPAMSSSAASRSPARANGTERTVEHARALAALPAAAARMASAWRPRRPRLLLAIPILVLVLVRVAVASLAAVLVLRGGLVLGSPERVQGRAGARRRRRLAPAARRACLEPRHRRRGRNRGRGGRRGRASSSEELAGGKSAARAGIGRLPKARATGRAAGGRRWWVVIEWRSVQGQKWGGGRERDLRGTGSSEIEKLGRPRQRRGLSDAVQLLKVLASTPPVVRCSPSECVEGPTSSPLRLRSPAVDRRRSLLRRRVDRARYPTSDLFFRLDECSWTSGPRTIFPCARPPLADPHGPPPINSLASLRSAAPRVVDQQRSTRPSCHRVWSGSSHNNIAALTRLRLGLVRPPLLEPRALRRAGVHLARRTSSRLFCDRSR